MESNSQYVCTYKLAREIMKSREKTTIIVNSYTHTHCVIQAIVGKLFYCQV